MRPARGTAADLVAVEPERRRVRIHLEGPEPEATRQIGHVVELGGSELRIGVAVKDQPRPAELIDDGLNLHVASTCAGPRSRTAGMPLRQAIVVSL